MLKAWDGTLDPAFFQELWPRLALLSAWDDAASEPHALRLRTLLPQARFQGKALWATEGVVTIPFGEARPLALTSHFLEFRCLATERILPAWVLEPGQEVQPLLSTSGGLLRYALDDRLRVTGLLGRTPCLSFMGRLGGTDLVGEKLDEAAVSELLNGLEGIFGLRCLTLFAVTGAPGRYLLLAEGNTPPEPLADALESRLLAFHHYQLARDLKQLASAEVLVLPDAAPVLASLAKARGQGAGEAKISRLDIWPVTLLRAPRATQT